MKKIIPALVLIFVLSFACACNEGGAIVSSDLASSTPAREESSTVETSSVKVETESSEEKTSSLSASDASSEPKPKFEKLSEKYSAKASVQSVSLSGATSKSAASFSYELFKNSYANDKNVILSPISALSALSMAVNGAEGQTLLQMEAALGADRDTLNRYLYNYRKSLSNDTFLLSQSVWLKNGVNPSDEFMQANADYHDADVFSVAMDNDTVNKINDWTSEKTRGEIKRLIDSIDSSTACCLVNATIFEAKWHTPYTDKNIKKFPFNNADSSITPAEYLFSQENKYISGDGYCGFVKYYDDYRYAFATFLPDSNSSLTALINSLDGEELINAVTSAEKVTVEALMPTFKTEFATSLVPSLKKMGMKNAFSSNAADFSKICKPCWISDIFQKAKIEVTRYGTKAAAATIVLKPGAAPPNASKEIKYVTLDRPFLYAIIDTEADLPIFIGTTSYIK